MNENPILEQLKREAGIIGGAQKELKEERET